MRLSFWERRQPCRVSLTPQGFGLSWRDLALQSVAVLTGCLQGRDGNIEFTVNLKWQWAALYFPTCPPKSLRQRTMGLERRPKNTWTGLGSSSVATWSLQTCINEATASWNSASGGSFLVLRDRNVSPVISGFQTIVALGTQVQCLGSPQTGQLVSTTTLHSLAIRCQAAHKGCPSRSANAGFDEGFSTGAAIRNEGLRRSQCLLSFFNWTLLDKKYANT